MITHTKDEKGNVDTSRQLIADTFAIFYEQLYDSEVAKKESETNQNIQSHHSKIPPCSQKEVNGAIAKLKKPSVRRPRVKVEMLNIPSRDKKRITRNVQRTHHIRGIPTQ